MMTRSPKQSDPWQKVSLGDCGAWRSGGTPSTKEADYWDGDIPWFTSSSLTTFRLRESVRTLTQVGLENGSRLVQPGTVLFVVRGMSLNTEFRVGITQQPSAFGQDCKALIAADGINAEFLGYSLKAHEQVILGMVSHAAHGTGKLDTDFLKGLRIPMPTLEIQENVVGVLASIDDLIENNRRRIELLEEAARLLYQEWFVNFRYPGHEDIPLVDSEVGPIPQDWEVINLFELADVGFGFSFKSKAFADSGARRVVRIRNVPKNTTSTWTDETATDRYLIHDGDTLIGMDGNFHMCIWADGPAYLNQRVARIRTECELPQLLLHLALEQPIKDFNQTITGTTVAHLGKQHLQEIQLPVPTAEIAVKTSPAFEAAQGLLQSLRQTNTRLQEARDLLLPRLVSGDLDISDFDLDLEAVS